MRTGDGASGMADGVHGWRVMGDAPTRPAPCQNALICDWSSGGRLCAMGCGGIDVIPPGLSGGGGGPMAPSGDAGGMAPWLCGAGSGGGPMAPGDPMFLASCISGGHIPHGNCAQPTTGLAYWRPSCGGAVVD